MADAGKYRYRATIIKPCDTRGEMGSEIADWEPLREVWCASENLSARIVANFRAQDSYVTTRFDFRFIDERFSILNRLVFRGAVYILEEVTPDYATRETTVLAYADTVK